MEIIGFSWTYMKEIFSAYATFATITLSDKNVNKVFLILYGSGATRIQNVPISAASSMKVKE